MAREGQFDVRCEDAQLPRRVVVDEDGLAESELVRDRLAVFLGDQGTFDHTERVAEPSALVGEHSQHPYRGRIGVGRARAGAPLRLGHGSCDPRRWRNGARTRSRQWPRS